MGCILASDKKQDQRLTMIKNSKQVAPRSVASVLDINLNPGALTPLAVGQIRERTSPRAPTTIRTTSNGWKREKETNIAKDKIATLFLVTTSTPQIDIII